MAKYCAEIFYIPVFQGSWAFFAYFAPVFCIQADKCSQTRMRALIISCVILFTFCEHSFAQVGNEWIVFNQQYFKIPVGKEGIYRLNLAAL